MADKRIYDNNVKALTEQIQTWKTKTGDLVAEKTVLEGDVKLLKQTNEELYEQVKKLKAKPKEVVYIKTESNNPHIVYNDIQGVVLPKKEPMFTISTGPSFSTGYGLINKNFDFYAGWSVIIGYNIKSFGRKK